MTTIAYRDGIIAYDSRVTRGSLIDHDDFDKLIHRNGHQFLLSGSGPDFMALLDEFFGVSFSDKPLDAHGIAITNGRICLIGHEAESGFWIDDIWLDRPFATGSGRDFALAAMDMGAGAEDGVRAAMKRDVYTGGTIRTIEVSAKVQAEASLAQS